MTYSILVEPEDLQDLKNIFHYISEQDSKNKAADFINELRNAITSLSTMPYRCRKSFYTDDENTRDMIYKGYTIVFNVREDKVHVLTLFRQKTFLL
ncbi:type II toxin-antitoxin system RelE/ParE family toxin [Sulfuricurvum sp.]|uniref:type II toxin-antitoxin system RelE/ParE family toxin n=1 Tax=Sulfuricurvum sp. TaxID=2025608 RepID=UPI0035615E1B